MIEQSYILSFTKTNAMRVFKDWKTSVAGAISAILLACGFFWPEQLDPESQEVLNTAVNEILVGLGAVVGFITNLLAKDPK